MINAVRTYFNPLPPPVIEAKPFDADEIKRRVENFADQAMEYRMALHTPTESEKADLEQLLIDCPTERFRKDMTRSCYGCWVNVRVDPIYSGGFASVGPDVKATNWIAARRRFINLHPLMLLKPNDIPKELQLSGLDDPLLREDDYYIKLLKWVCEKFNLEEKDFGELIEFRGLFQTYLRFWKDPESITNVQNFALAHEVGHLHHKHTSYMLDFVLSIVLTCCVTAVLFFNTSLLLVIAGATTTYLVSSVALRCFNLLYYRDDERVADLTALKLVKTTKGAELLFETIHKVQELIWKKIPWFQKIYLFAFYPEAFLHLSHPAPKDRIAYIKEAHLLESQKLSMS